MRIAIAIALTLAACSKEPTTVRVSAPTKEAPDDPLRPGAVAPAFEATAHDGSTVSLASLRGRPVVLYFYPKDDTAGCTVEAQGFRDTFADFAAAGATIVGVSTDGLASHREFAARHHLPFLLIADTDGRLAKSYGVGSTLGFTHRITFVIAPDGKVAATFDDVDPDAHAPEVLAAVRARAR